METPKLSSNMDDYQSNVDTSRPFRSVKEAVAIFGERFLAKEIYSPKQFTFPTQESPWNNNNNNSYYSPSPPRSANYYSQEILSASSPSPNNDQDFNNNNDPLVVDALKKLETELEETKTELKLLKERESQTEIALASLNAELHKNMSKLAQAEAAHAGAMAKSRSVNLNNENYGTTNNYNPSKEDEKKKEIIRSVRWEASPTLAEMLTIGESRDDDLGLFGTSSVATEKKIKEKKKNKYSTMKKIKPIIPLVGDLLFSSSRKKRSSSTNHTLDNPLFASSHLF